MSIVRKKPDAPLAQCSPGYCTAKDHGENGAHLETSNLDYIQTECRADQQLSSKDRKGQWPASLQSLPQAKARDGKDKPGQRVQPLDKQDDSAHRECTNKRTTVRNNC